jgi:basic membrane protein A
MNKILFLLTFLFSSTLSFAAPLKVALVLDKGGRDDKSFNSAAYAGVEKAQKELGVSMKYVEATDDAAIENLTRAFAQKDFDLIVCVGFAMADAVKKVAAQFPQKHFAIIDAEVAGANVRSLLFDIHR